MASSNGRLQHLLEAMCWQETKPHNSHTYKHNLWTTLFSTASGSRQCTSMKLVVNPAIPYPRTLKLIIVYNIIYNIVFMWSILQNDSCLYRCSEEGLVFLNSDIDDFLEPHEGPSALPPASQTVSVRNVQMVYEICLKSNVNPMKAAIVIDADTGNDQPQWTDT